MGAEHPALLVDDLAGSLSEAVAPQERAVVVAREEARLLALGPSRNGEPCVLCFGTGRLLVLLAEREPDAAEMLRVETCEHVRLILLRVGASMQEQSPAMLTDSRVVAGGEPVAAGAACEGEQL